MHTRGLILSLNYVFSFNGDTYLYYFFFAVTPPGFVLSHYYNNSMNFVGLIYDLN